VETLRPSKVRGGTLVGGGAEVVVVGHNVADLGKLDVVVGQNFTSEGGNRATVVLLAGDSLF